MERQGIGKACRYIDEIFDECPREKELGDAVGTHNARSLEPSTEERKTRGKHLREGKRGVGRATRLECFTRSYLKGVKRIPWWGWFSVKKLLGKVTTWVDNENATDCGLLTAASRKVEIINLRFKLTHMLRVLISEYSSLTTSDRKLNQLFSFAKMCFARYNSFAYIFDNKPLITHLIEYYRTIADFH
ncbi:hypothetical protein V1478_013830 [Vespula squamosa]|uniref:Uncharacterized protein n=1 Tax=Vespula squamosa TaxID=30214 RepID=A0ABD2A6B4_VESSQ